MNIISNSIKYCEGDPHVIIRSRMRPENLLELSFSDNGIGFDENT